MTTPLTEADLTEAEALLAAATPGPWTSHLWNSTDAELAEADRTEVEDLIRGANGARVVGASWYDGMHINCTEEDAALIAAAPSLLSSLIATVRDLRTRLGGAHAEIGRLVDENDALTARVREVDAERDNTSAAILMIGSEAVGDPKVDASDRCDPRWTPTLLEVATLRARAEAAERERDEARRWYLECAVAIGVYYEADGHARVAGPLDAVVAHIESAVKDRDEARAERDALRAHAARACRTCHGTRTVEDADTNDDGGMSRSLSLYDCPDCATRPGKDVDRG